MNGHPEMPYPGTEMAPRELVKAIEDWAAEQGTSTEPAGASSEYGKVVVRDPADGSTSVTIPNATRAEGSAEIRFATWCASSTETGGSNAMSVLD